MFRIILFLTFTVTGICAKEPVFDWEEEPSQSPKTEVKKSNPLPPMPPSNSTPIPPDPFQDPFFTRDPDFDAIQKQFRERQKAMMDRMMNFFNSSGMGMPFKDPFDDPFFQIPGRKPAQNPGRKPVPIPPMSSPNLKNRTAPMNSFFPTPNAMSPKFIDKGDLLLVELPVSNGDQSQFQVQVEGNLVRVTQTTQSSSKNESPNSRSQFQSYSSSSQSFTLPTAVKKNFVQNLVGDTLVLTFRKL